MIQGYIATENIEKGQAVEVYDEFKVRRASLPKMYIHEYWDRIYGTLAFHKTVRTKYTFEFYSRGRNFELIKTTEIDL